MAMIMGVEYQLGGQRMDRHDKHTLYTWHLLNQVNVPYKMLGLAEHESDLKSIPCIPAQVLPPGFLLLPPPSMVFLLSQHVQ